jgi:hypothetical protein
MKTNESLNSEHRQSQNRNKFVFGIPKQTPDICDESGQFDITPIS